MIEAGDTAPDFELQDQDGNPVRLSDHRGQTVVLYFYPKADTPGCTTQACGIRDRRAGYEAAGAVVLGVSPDKPEALRKFADKYGLPFTVYGRRYMGVQRATFLIDPDGQAVSVIPKVNPKTHDDDVLALLAAAA